MTEENATPRQRNIYERMVAIMRDVGHIGKDSKNTFHHFDYRGIDGVLNALGPAMRQHGVFLRVETLGMTVETVETGKDRKLQRFARARVSYSFKGLAGDEVECIVEGEAFDSGDKAVTKAMSVALRTCLLQTFVMPTHEQDPDSRSDELSPSKSPPQPLRGSQSHEAERAPVNGMGPLALTVRKAEMPEIKFAKLAKVAIGGAKMADVGPKTSMRSILERLTPEDAVILQAIVARAQIDGAAEADVCTGADWAEWVDLAVDAHMTGLKAEEEMS